MLFSKYAALYKRGRWEKHIKNALEHSLQVKFYLDDVILSVALHF